MLKAFPARSDLKTTGFLVVCPLTTTGLVVGGHVHEHAVGLRVEVMAGFVVGIGLRVVALESVGSLTGGMVVTVAFNNSMATSLFCKMLVCLVSCYADKTNEVFFFNYYLSYLLTCTHNFK